MSDPLRTFLALARKSTSLGQEYPGAQFRTTPFPHLDFTHCDDPMLQYLRYFADHPGPVPAQAIAFNNGLARYKESLK